VKDMLKVEYVPLLQECCKVYEDGFGNAVARHMGDLLSFGMSLSRVLNRKDERVEQDPRLVHYGLANCVWAGLVDMWWNMDSGAREAFAIQEQSVEIVIESLMDVLDDQVDLKAAIGTDNGMKVLQFWLSHIGKLAKKFPEAGGLIIERFWVWAIRFRDACMGLSAIQVPVEEREEKICKLVSRVTVACLNNQSKKAMETRFLTPLRKQIASSSLDGKKAALIVSVNGVLAESEGFSPSLLSLGMELADEVLKAFVMPRIQSKITYYIINDTSRRLVEFLVNFMAQSTDPDAAVVLLLRYSVCPHPSLMAVLSNVWMDLVRYSSESMQMIFIESLESLLARMASNLAGGIRYQCPPQAMLQVKDLYAMCCSQASQRNFNSIINRLKHRIDTEISCYDVCVIAEIAYIASGLCPRGGKEVADLGEKLAQTMVEKVEKALDGDNSPEILSLVSWCEEAISESFMLMMSDKNKKIKAATVERILTSLNRLVDSYKQQGAEFDSIPVFKMLLRCHQAIEFLGLLGVMHRIQKPLLNLASAVCTHPCHPAFGYMLAAIIHDKTANSSLLKTIFRGALVGDSTTEPLRIIALKSYIEYIRQCPQENITAVLPDELVYQASGKPNADFKLILSAYVEGTRSNQNDAFATVQKEGMLSMAHAHMSKMAFKPCAFPKQAPAQDSENMKCNPKIEEVCNNAKDSIRGLLSSLENKKPSMLEADWQCLKRHVVDIQVILTKIRDAYIPEV